MKSLLPWILIFLVLWVIVSCFNVGLQFSLLIIGVVCCTLYIVYSLIKKSSNKDATEKDKRNTDLSLKAVVGISIGLIIIGIILTGVGMITARVDYELQACEYCGGIGRLSSGKECWGCKGAGGFIEENRTHKEFTWFGILMAASGAILYVGTKQLKYNAENKEQESDEHTLKIEIPGATFLLSFGHMTSSILNKKWIAHKPDGSGSWSIRCNVYLWRKATKIALCVIPYNASGSKISGPKEFSYEGEFYYASVNTFNWNNLWPGEQLSRIAVTKIKVYFEDGTIQETNH